MPPDTDASDFMGNHQFNDRLDSNPDTDANMKVAQELTVANANTASNDRLDSSDMNVARELTNADSSMSVAWELNIIDRLDIDRLDPNSGSNTDSSVNFAQSTNDMTNASSNDIDRLDQITNIETSMISPLDDSRTIDCEVEDLPPLAQNKSK